MTDTTESLLEQYDDAKSRKLDDIIATQAVICVLLAAALFVLNLFYPDIAKELFDRLKNCMDDTAFTLPNPLDILISYLQSR
ncbi:MAG: hypothetical protein IJ779_10770 [Ruminococcus sp.]|nr:hypothetical protein [Ruminococcus sp.]